MTTSEDATMAKPGEKAPPFRPVPHTKKNKKAKEGVTDEGEIQHTFIYPLRILMTPDDRGTKKTYKATFNPIPKTKTLLLTMAKNDPGLSITSLDGKNKLIITADNFPNTEDTFKKYFKCKWEK